VSEWVLVQCWLTLTGFSSSYTFVDRRKGWLSGRKFQVCRTGLNLCGLLIVRVSLGEEVTSRYICAAGGVHGQ